MQDAIVSALEHWPREGVPEVPAAWLLTVARRKGIDRLRRETRYRQKLAVLEEEARTAVVDPTEARGRPVAATAADERIELMFTCCHPALSRDAQVALTLRSVLGLTTPEIAKAFLVPEATLAQRIVRAKRKIVEAGITFRAPEPRELPERLEQAPSWEATDWPQVLRLYDALLAMTASPVVRLNRAIALRQVAGPEMALAEVDGIAGDLDRYHLLHATRAELLRDLGRTEEARESDRRALELTDNPAERALLEERIRRV